MACRSNPRLRAPARAASGLLPALSLAASLLVAPPATAAPRLALEPCRLEHPQGAGSVAARCGTLEVAEDPAKPDGRRVGLAVAVIPAISTRAKPDPLFLLAGGPGQGARETFVPFLPAFAGVRRSRDLVLVDQRGTGESNRLGCDMPEETWAEADLPPEALGELAQDCLAMLPGDPRYYTTSVAVRDLDAVRAALGYERINLYGGSYGTRVAQHYARRYPAHTRSVTLDSAVHPALALGPGMALDAEAALRAGLARCDADAACAERFGDLDAAFDALRARLAAGPVDVRLADPVNGETRVVEFTSGHLALAVRLLSYSAQTAALLPLLIHEAQANDNLVPLAAQAEMIGSMLGESIAYGMHNAVVCTEDLPFVVEGHVDREALRRSYLGEEMLAGLEAMCAVWPRGLLDPDLRSPVVSSVPALVLSGSLDPVTPPTYGTAAAAGFRDNLHVVFEGQGHLQLGLHCAQQLLRRFLEAGTARGLDAACAEEVKPLPFFLGFNGGAP
jgi:pimeloyl-ACP methyl ester carboxylesterase